MRVLPTTTRTRFADPALTASAAARSAFVPACSESHASAVVTSRRRSRARATITAPCFSLMKLQAVRNTTDAQEAQRIIADAAPRGHLAHDP